MAPPRPTLAAALETLTQARLAMLGREFGVAVSEKAKKADQVAVLARPGIATFPGLLRALGRNELKAICKKHGIETGARGLEIDYGTLEQHVLPEFQRRRIPWVPVPPGLPDDEILLWRRDRRGKTRTLWLSTKAPGLVVADIPGFYLGSSNTLWRWQPSETLLPFLTGDDLDYPPDEEQGEIVLEPVEDAHLEDTGNGARIPLGVLPGLRPGRWVMDFYHTVDPVGTFGNILLVHANGWADYGGMRGVRDADFLALDLESGQRFELWTPEEAQHYLMRHGERAELELGERLQCGFPESADGSSDGSEPPSVTMCLPSNDDTYQLRARLQITFDVVGADTDDSWVDYCASTTVDAETLPALLHSVATAPAILRAYWDEHPIDDRCGWSRVPSPGPARERLEALVREHQPSGHQHLGSSPRA